MKQTIAFIFMLMLLQPVFAAKKVTANGLFYGKAVLTIDGKQTLLNVGDKKHGVELLEADEDHAVVKVNGKKRFVYLDKTIAKEYSTPNEFKRHNNAKSHVISAQLMHQAPNLATFEVEYYYREKELGDFVTLSAKTLFRKEDTDSWAHTYTRLKPGRNTIAITVSMNEEVFDGYLSDAVQFDLVSNKNGKASSSGTLVLKFVKEWKR